MKLWRSTIALWLPILAVSAADQPLMKEGLWSIHMVTTDQPGGRKTEGSRSLCRSHAYDEHARSLKAPNCKTISETSSAGTIKTETECKVGGSVLRTKGVVTYTETAAHSENHTTYTPPINGLSESTMIMDQKYVGACPAGTGPGDSIGADGRVTHLWKQ